MTHWTILLEPAADGQTTATVLELPEFKVTGSTRQIALNEIQQLLTQRLANTEVVSVSIPPTAVHNPWLKFGGMFENDADFEAIAQAIQTEREETL